MNARQAVAVASQVGIKARATMARVAPVFASLREAVSRHRFNLAEVAGVALALTGVSQFSVPVSCILGGILLVYACEVHSAPQKAPAGPAVAVRPAVVPLEARRLP